MLDQKIQKPQSDPSSNKLQRSKYEYYLNHQSKRSEKNARVELPLILLKHFECSIVSFLRNIRKSCMTKKGIIVFLGKTQLLNVLLHILGADKH